tara:strand:- start:351 stop:545 length:195 start_codon:yes stop_codon:yes gene_type:complete
MEGGNNMPFLVPIITGTLKGMLVTFFTQKMVEELIFQLLRYAVAQSSNKLDDQILAAFEEQRSK